jgi:hypothetical protein
MVVLWFARCVACSSAGLQGVAFEYFAPVPGRMICCDMLTGYELINNGIPSKPTPCLA